MKLFYVATVLASAALAVPQGVQRPREEHSMQQEDDIKKVLRRQTAGQCTAIPQECTSSVDKVVNGFTEALASGSLDVLMGAANGLSAELTSSGCMAKLSACASNLPSNPSSLPSAVPGVAPGGVRRGVPS